MASLPSRGSSLEEKYALQKCNPFGTLFRSDALRQLSGLPYYCSLLLEEFLHGGLLDMRHDYEVLERVVSGMIEREQQKGLLRHEHFDRGGLDEWLEEVALEYYSGGMNAIPRDHLNELGELVLREELTAEERRNALTTLEQFPLFEGGLAPNTVVFKHELVAEYLAGRCLSRRFARDPGGVARNLGMRPDLSDSMIARYLVSEISALPNAVVTLQQALATLHLPGKQFGNLLLLLLMLTPDRGAVRGISLEGRDLSHVLFFDRDLRGTSFRNCDLTATVFRACDLRQAKFEGAVLNGTRFENLDQDALRGARFGDLEHFEYILVDKRRLDDYHEAVEWIATATGEARPIRGPCPTALQVTVLFQKYVRPDGTGRRDELPRRALLRGKRYPGAPPPEDCVQAGIKFGFLDEPDRRDRIRRTTGERYDQVVEFVKDRRLTSDVKQLLDSLCPLPGCDHLP